MVQGDQFKFRGICVSVFLGCAERVDEEKTIGVTFKLAFFSPQLQAMEMHMPNI